MHQVWGRAMTIEGDAYFWITFVCLLLVIVLHSWEPN